MKRIAVLFARCVFIIPAVGCEGSGDGAAPAPGSEPGASAKAEPGKQANPANPNGPRKEM